MSKVPAIGGSLGLWFALLAGLVLPSLLSIGYGLFDLEVILIIIFIAVLSVSTVALFHALQFHPLSRRAEYIMAAVIVSLNVHIYYIPFIRYFGLFMLFSCTIFLALKLRRAFMFAGATASVFAIIFATLNAPNFWRVEIPPLAAIDAKQPAVIHLLLDEFAAPEGLPKSVFSEEEIKKFTDWFVSKDFQVFSRSFSLYSRTRRSFAQLANTESENMRGIIKRLKGNGGSELISSETFSTIAKQWQIRAISSYIDIMPALKQAPNPVSGTVINLGVPKTNKYLHGLSVSDRIKITGGLLHRWLLRTQGVGFYIWVVRKTGSFGQSISRFSHARSRLHPLGSMIVLEKFIAYEIPRMRRGQYLFAHLILPHNPYVFKENCSLRPPSDWRTNKPPRGTKRTLKFRAETYKLYFEQVLCMQHKLAEAFAAIRSNPELHDAVIILHGDHGARISVGNGKGMENDGYDEAAFLRDRYAAFFAVKIFGKPGSKVDDPIAIHDLFGELVRAEFSDLNIDNIERRPLSDRMFP
jgi:Sulfatase